MVVWAFGGYLFCFGPENKVLANFCFALSYGVTIGFFGFISAGETKVGFAISTSTLGFGSRKSYYFFLTKIRFTFMVGLGKGMQTVLSSAHKE